MNIISIVNYNNVSITEDFILRFKDVNESNILLVVDNSLSKLACESLEEKYSSENIMFLYPKENLGYMRAGAFAYNYIKDKFSFDFFILSNNDIIIDDDQFFDKLDSYNNLDQDIMLLSPSVIDEQRNVNPYMRARKSEKYMKLWSFILSSYIMAWVFNKLISIKSKFNRNYSNDRETCNENIYGTHGSIFILNKSFFNRGGTLDELPFLYGEEIYISEQILLMNGKCIYVDDFKFSHNSSSTLGKKYTYFKFKCICEAHAFLMKRYY
ncbi:glycosyltransferase family 2 protein [Photobacterium phosphoreum]|uniref:Glycosyltransferase family 2 protein n=1 Tax=Photobacterium phosphoreum TaxID=659 RepID=A0AAW4ZIQ1_PHOPO|nr:glycosyltransferase family 2 protein [Photobacterium phosphoreum]MCD9490698.1 glycosyltransferase family 2 protein [Photobacterium phosphoreum]MCF2189964.1 glycosyltransferase family 2 protein [Photobacterium phosphoreum]MCF2300827.1 glycosyltransferase family 2 protein [Photobacterium phosphoreum]